MGLEEKNDIRVEKGLGFGAADGKPLLADLYAPADAQRPCAVFVFVHGGGWIAGSRASGEGLGRLLAAEGYACLCIDYRLARNGAPSYPGALEDVRAALDFIGRDGASLGLDASRLVLPGASPGGHPSARAPLPAPPSPPPGRPLGARSAVVGPPPGSPPARTGPRGPCGGCGPRRQRAGARGRNGGPRPRGRMELSLCL